MRAPPRLYRSRLWFDFTYEHRTVYTCAVSNLKVLVASRIARAICDHFVRHRGVHSNGTNTNGPCAMPVLRCGSRKLAVFSMGVVTVVIVPCTGRRRMLHAILPHVSISISSHHRTFPPSTCLSNDTFTELRPIGLPSVPRLVPLPRWSVGPTALSAASLALSPSLLYECSDGGCSLDTRREVTIIILRRLEGKRKEVRGCLPRVLPSSRLRVVEK